MSSCLNLCRTRCHKRRYERCGYEHCRYEHCYTDCGVGKRIRFAKRLSD